MNSEMLQLRGGIDLLRSALRNIPVSGWRGATYYNMTAADKEAYSILALARSSLYADLKALLGQNKEFMQAAVLGSIGHGT